MKKRRLKKFLTKKYSPFKDKEGNLIQGWDDEVHEDKAVIWPASGKIQATQYGLRLNYIMNMNYYGALDLREKDMIIYEDNQYLILLIRRYRKFKYVEMERQ